MLNNVGLADGGETAGGFLMRDGEIAPIAECETDVRARPGARVPALVRSACDRRRGRATTLRGRARRGGASAPAPRRPADARERGSHRVRVGRPQRHWHLGIPDANGCGSRPHEHDSDGLRHLDPARGAAPAADPLRHDQPAGQRAARASPTSRGCSTRRGSRRAIRAREPERPNLIARLPGRGAAPPLLLYGHVDVVTTAGQRWSRPPFEALEQDGFIWGRGAVDMKGGVAMMLSALLRARRRGPRAGRRRDLLRARGRGEHERVRRRVAGARAPRAVRRRAVRDRRVRRLHDARRRAALLSDPGRREAGLHAAGDAARARPATARCPCAGGAMAQARAGCSSGWTGGGCRCTSRRSRGRWWRRWRARCRARRDRSCACC